jgi:hypothetical protein
MIDESKVTAVRQYLTQEFPVTKIRDWFDSGRMAQCFEIESGKTWPKAIFSEEFLEDHADNEIPALLKGFLLAEHLKECDLPIVVTNDGLSTE